MKVPISAKDSEKFGPSDVDYFRLSRDSDPDYQKTLIARYHYSHSRDETHQALIKTKNPLINGWRNPAPYQCYALNMDRKSYDYRIHTLGDKYQYLGFATDAQGGFGPPASLDHWGTRVYLGAYYPDVTLQLVNDSIEQARQNLIGEQVNLTTAAAELGKTVEYLVSTLVKIARSLHHAKDGKIKEALQVLFPGGSTATHGATTWLEYVYSIMPLISDFANLQQSVALPPREGDADMHVTGTSTRGYPFPTFSGYDWIKQSGDITTSAQTIFWFKMSDEIVARLNRFGLNHNHHAIFVTAWELIPFSFVFDWFTSISRNIEALAAVQSGVYDFVSGTTTEKMTRDHTIQCVKTVSKYLKPAAGQTPFDGQPPTIHYRSVCMYRYVHHELPPSVFYIRNPFSTPHNLSAIALLASARVSLKG